MSIKGMWRRLASQCGAAGTIMGLSLPATAQEIQRPKSSERVQLEGEQIPSSNVGQLGELTSGSFASPSAVNLQSDRNESAETDFARVAQLTRDTTARVATASQNGQIVGDVASHSRRAGEVAGDLPRPSKVASLGQTRVDVPGLARDAGLPPVDSNIRSIPSEPPAPRTIKP